MKSVLNERKQRQASKRSVVEEKIHITRPEIIEGIFDAEKKTREKGTQKGKKSKQIISVVISNMPEDRNDVLVFDSIRVMSEV